MLLFAMSVLIGSFFFLLIYGTTPLHVSNDSWIMAAIDEDDIVQHYAGWLMYRNSDWTFPLGMIPDMARGTGTSISYTDSIPLAAILFKIIFRITGYSGAFQYFGLFTLLCFILQCYGAGLLIKRKTKNLFVIALGMALFVTAPPLLDRSLRHTALGAQFLVLFAIHEYFRIRDRGYENFAWKFMLLGCLSVGIHPYFLPMVMIFSFLTMVEGIVKAKNVIKHAGQFAAACATSLALAWALGVFESSGDFERSGFGYYSMNILAAINPNGGVDYHWSKLLPAIPIVKGNYEGFNYLGAGVILLWAAVLACLAVQKIAGSGSMSGRAKNVDIAENVRMSGSTKTADSAENELTFSEQSIPVSPASANGLLRNNLGYILAMAFMTLFSLSNIVTFADKILFTVPLPEWFTNLCGIYQTSGRMFYPVFYSIYILGIYMLCRLFKNKKALCIGALLVITALQLFDLSDVFAKKHSDMAQAAFCMSLIDDPTLEEMAEGCDFIVGTEKFRDVCVFAGLHNMATSFSASTGGYWDAAYEIRDSYLEDLRNGIHDGHTMFVTKSWTWAHEWLDANPDMTLYQYGDKYYLR